jgi:hypothetical protein
MSFLKSLPSGYQFRLLRQGVIIGLLAPLLAVGLIIKTISFSLDYRAAIRDAGQLMKEGKLVAVPLTGEAPRWLDFRKAYSCSLRLADGITVQYLRKEKPTGNNLYFFEHPEVTGSLLAPQLNFEPGEPAQQVIVEVSANPQWHETFAALAGGSFTRKTCWLLALSVLTIIAVWLAWKSYWWMKGGRRRSRGRR